LTATKKALPRSVVASEIPDGVENSVNAGPGDRIRDKGSHRIPPGAKRFIIRAIMEGYSNGAIDDLLRRKKYMDAKQRPLDRTTLFRLRDSEECVMDISRLSLEARQIGHNSVSQAVVMWRDLQVAAYRKLLNNQDEFPRKGTLGYGFKQMTVSECANLAATATKFLMELFGSDLAEQIRAELASIKAGTAETVRDKPTIDEVKEYMDNVLVNAYDRVMRRIASEGAEAVGVPAEVVSALVEGGD
jgi:hypothetical protein